MYLLGHNQEKLKVNSRSRQAAKKKDFNRITKKVNNYVPTRILFLSRSIVQLYMKILTSSPFFLIYTTFYFKTTIGMDSYYVSCQYSNS